jgi:hypothetical protein
MTLLSDMALDVSGLFGTGQLGESALYHSNGGWSKEITVIIDRSQDMGQAPGGSANLATIYVQMTDITAPTIYDRVEIGSEEYVIRAVSSGTGVLWVLQSEETRRMSPQSGA